jgi:hypothetical protein
MIAALITQHHGEYVFRIGAQPSRAKLFSDSDTTDDPGWTGTSRTVQELDALRNEMTKLVEEVGGKVTDCLSLGMKMLNIIHKTSVLFESRTGSYPRASLLLRLPPLNVSLTPEVRCAVVGNVDSGKSTTLGVLTRGMRSFPIRPLF